MLVKLKSETGGPVVVQCDAVDNKPSTIGKQIILVDGWNEIPQEDWPLVEKHMEMGIESGKFTLKCKTIDEEVTIDGVKTTRPVRVQQSLSEVRADIARDVVKGCYNPFVLEAWAKDPSLSGELRALADIALKEIDKIGKDQ
jgi:hypothetical protein